MSEVVDLDLRDVDQPRGRPPKYNWDLWFDGRTHRLVQGHDYMPDLRSFRSSVYSAAKRYGLEVKALVISGDLHIQAFPEAPPKTGHTTPEEGAPDGEGNEG